MQRYIGILTVGVVFAFMIGCGMQEGGSDTDEQLHFGMLDKPYEEGNCATPPCEAPSVDYDMCSFVQNASGTIAIVELLEDQGPRIGDPLDCETPDEYASSIHYEYDVVVRKVAAGETSLEGETLRVVDIGLSYTRTSQWNGVELKSGDQLMMGLRQARGEWFNVNSLMVASDPDDLRPEVIRAEVWQQPVVLPGSFTEFSRKATDVLSDHSGQCPHVGGSYMDDSTFEEVAYVPRQPKCGLTE